MNEWLNQQITLKVYQVGLAQNDKSYQKENAKLFENLTALDTSLANSHYLFGDEITLSDFFLFPTLVRYLECRWWCDDKT